MAIYEKRMQDDLNYIREQVHSMGDMVEKLLENAVHALLSGNQQMANDTVLADHPVNRQMRNIDKLCHGFIARHLPSAGHLRLISSFIRVNIELERVGDYAVTISRESLQLESPLQGLMADELGAIASESRRMMQQALTALYQESGEQARATAGMSAHMESTLDSVYGHLMSGEHTRNNKEMFVVFAVLTQLKRVADQAKNICEETIFADTGETKAKKVYSILFLDSDNSGISQMAEVIARHNFPNSGNYQSAGREAASQLNHTMTGFLAAHSMNLDRALPKKLEMSHQELAQLHVVISLDGSVSDYLPSIPFHTVFLDWDVGQLGEDSDSERYAEIYRELSCRIRDLMELLRGKGAD